LAQSFTEKAISIYRCSAADAQSVSPPGMAVWGIILSLHRYPEADYEVWLTHQVHTARRIAAGQLLLLGITLVIVVGF
jgi:hypothetical protein